MTDCTTRKCTMTIGIDLGNRYSNFAVLDEAGELVEEGRLRSTPAVFHQQFAGRPQSRIAIEVGTHSPWVDRILRVAGHEVLVANPRKLRFNFKGETKNDRVDAEQLARVARLDPKLLAPIQHRKHQARIDLAVLRARDGLVRARTQLVNQVRGLVKPFGIRIGRCSTRVFGNRAVRQIPKDLRPSIVPLLRTIDTLAQTIRKYDKRIEKMAKDDYAEIECLRQVDGVGSITAMTFVLTLEDPHRFRTSRAVGAYLGLRPRQRQSGSSDPELRISKAGDRDVRKLLVQSAQYILGPFGKDCDLRRKGLAMAARGNKVAKRKAVVALARKLAVLLHRLWLTGEVYEPLRTTAQQEPVSMPA